MTNERDDSTTGDELNPFYSEETAKVVDELCSTRESIVKPDKDLIEQINELFPTEQSLSQLDSVISSVESEITSLDEELARLVEGQSEAIFEGEKALQEAQSAMTELEKRIDSIREKTQSSDAVVREMTRDIKQLDVAKRNLTSSITTLHHLHILLAGVENLGAWTERRDYASIARQLPAVLNVLQLFERHSAVPHIAAITNELESLKSRLSRQLAADLKHSFKSGQLSETVTDMCRVTSALEGGVQADFCRWFVDQQLSEYALLYAENEEAAWIDRIEERYKWFVRKLTDFERTGMGAVFPSDWEMGRRLAKEFCALTADIFTRMLNRRRPDLDWKLLGHAIQHTKMFEALLMKRFPTKKEYNFDKVIWKVFDPFLDVFISAQEKTLNDFLDECSTRIRNGTECPSRETSLMASPFPSSADMFLLLKKVITESSKLSSQPDALLKDVISVVRTCLRNFAVGCLTAFLPSTNANTGNANASGATASALFQSFIRDDSAPVRLTPTQQFFTCCVLATADWCAETTAQLHEKLAQRLPGSEMNSEQETFYSIANSALSVLVNDLEISCDAALQAMTKINWSNVDSVGDESSFVSSIRNHLKQNVPVVRDLLADRRKYFAHLCLKLATQLSHKFVGALFRCRSVSTHGAEQLLLDTHSLKTFLLQLPSVESSVNTKPPTAYISAVNSVLGKAEMMLKIVMSPINSPDEFVENYVKLMPESDVAELQKVLDMRGLKRAEQTQLVTTYRSKTGQSLPPSTSEGLTTASSLQTNAMSQLGSVAAVGLDIADTSMRRLEKLVKKKL
uniref:Vacuolar protein sorting-associated protein 53 homolog n=1 Tax=Pristionchus pacificus TaxID=54126 RepID=A0A454XW50_PRIPA|eukprot:PDM65944.1 vps-53 [Pristionchus pacificus]